MEKSLLRDLITIADIRSDATSALHSTFVTNTGDDAQNTHKQDTVLVDHNAPQIPGLSSIDITSRLNITGVIDHHLDEDTIPASADPRIVKTGIGSCTSLVVQHLRDISLWASPIIQIRFHRGKSRHSRPPRPSPHPNRHSRPHRNRRQDLPSPTTPPSLSSNHTSVPPTQISTAQPSTTKSTPPNQINSNSSPSPRS